jgi:hypothetical protein
VNTILTPRKVRSFLQLKDLSNFGLRILTRESASKASMEGRRLCTDESKYPGLPLFQSRSFSSQEGDVVICDSVELRFSSEDARGIQYS